MYLRDHNLPRPSRRRRRRAMHFVLHFAHDQPPPTEPKRSRCRRHTSLLSTLGRAARRQPHQPPPADRTTQCMHAASSRQCACAGRKSRPHCALRGVIMLPAPVSDALCGRCMRPPHTHTHNTAAHAACAHPRTRMHACVLCVCVCAGRNDNARADKGATAVPGPGPVRFNGHDLLPSLMRARREQRPDLTANDGDTGRRRAIVKMKWTASKLCVCEDLQSRHVHGDNLNYVRT